MEKTENGRKTASELQPKMVRIDPSQTGFRRLLSGPPESATMKSGSVVLLPGESVGKHSTGEREELLVILSGQGEMQFAGSDSILFEQNAVLYCPPATEHNVINRGSKPLHYIYVVAKAF